MLRKRLDANLKEYYLPFEPREGGGMIITSTSIAVIQGQGSCNATLCPVAQDHSPKADFATQDGYEHDTIRVVEFVMHNLFAS